MTTTIDIRPPTAELKTILEILQSSDDTEIVLGGTLLLQNHILILLSAALHGGDETVKAIASSPAQQRELAYGIGLIDDSARHDLKLITKIRNRFAHQYPRPSLADNAIAGYIGNLTTADDLKHLRLNPRQIFIRTIYFYANRLNRRLAQVAKMRRGEVKPC